jgi:hypothetical protein
LPVFPSRDKSESKPSQSGSTCFVFKMSFVGKGQLHYAGFLFYKDAFLYL